MSLISLLISKRCKMRLVKKKLILDQYQLQTLPVQMEADPRQHELHAPSPGPHLQTVLLSIWERTAPTEDMGASVSSYGRASTGG